MVTRYYIVKCFECQKQKHNWKVKQKLKSQDKKQRNHTFLFERNGYDGFIE